MDRKQGIFRLLDTVGDGTGTKNAIGDYSSTPGSFKITDTTGHGLIERMIIMIEDAGTMDSGTYGNGLALTNGIRVYLRDTDDNILQEYTSFNILTNADWAGACHDVTRHSWGSGNEVLSIRWTFSKSGQPIKVKFDQGEYFEVYLNDSFTALAKHRFTVQGHYVTREI